MTSIRKATRLDIEGIRTVVKKHWRRIGKWWLNSEALYKAIKRDQVKVLVSDKTIEAFIVQRDKRIYAIATLIKGGGRALLRKCKRGSYALVSCSNIKAIKAYESCNFINLGRVKLYVNKEGRWFRLYQKAKF